MTSDRRQITSPVAPLTASQATNRLKDSIADVQCALMLNASILEPPGILDRGSTHLELTIPSDIRSCRTVHSFKRHLKTHNSNNYQCLCILGLEPVIAFSTMENNMM